ncbi:MAG: glycosyltransferase [Mixta calida]|uniref:glycosyltransferase family 2 protein n=1 Tax=Mixta calida TaxID=665913 RepID=UPI0016801D94|nr:glycosyltransferase [Mixta calida]MDU4943562.1 glycosyltransferase [Mixta calida]MDU6538833.1 glycosyltransferase [Mixta calida]QNU42124.1 glycosyltransferase [Mixta calida]
MIFNKKVGVGIVTYNRPAGLRKLLDSLVGTPVDEIIIVNDGKIYKDFDDLNATIIHNEKNLGVGKSKNIALRYLQNKDVEYFFLIEDDIYIKDGSVFQEYIKASRISGIQHFNFSQHGPNNRDERGMPLPATVINYENISIPLYGFCVGAFSFYTRKCLSKVGLMDEAYYNAMEHVDHTYEIIKAGMHPPFCYFADIADSASYLGDEVWSESQSTICRNEGYNQVKAKAINYFIDKHGGHPVDLFHNITHEQVAKAVIKIRSLHGVPVLRLR